MLHELGVMTPLHPYARALCDLGTARGRGKRTGVRDTPSRCADLRARRGLGWSRAGRQRLDGTPLQPETGAQRERPTNATPILKLHKVNAAGLLNPRHGSDPSGGDVLEDHTNLNMDGLRARTPRPGPVTMRVMGENIAAVGVCAIHPAYSSGTRISAGSRHE